MKKFLPIILSALLFTVFYGCSSEQPVSSKVGASASQASAVQEVSTESADYNVDWDKCLDDAKQSITGSSYPYVKDLTVQVDESKKLMTFTAVFDDSTDPQKALEYADTMLRQYNTFASQQDSTISIGSKESYGGLYDSYKVMIGIAPYSQIDNQSKWFVYDSIGKGVQTKHTIELEKPYR